MNPCRRTLLYAALDRFGRCDICFNNGALFEAGIIETVDIERLSSMVRVNVEGSFRVAYVFVKHFVSEGSGHLVNVSSVLGSSVRPTPYAATQRAIEALSDALAAELGDGGVLVSCIQPGLVKTGFTIAGRSRGKAPQEPDIRWSRRILRGWCCLSWNSRRQTHSKKTVSASELLPMKNAEGRLADRRYRRGAAEPRDLQSTEHETSGRL